MDECADDGHQHAEFGEVHAASGSFRVTKTFEAQNKKDRSE
jgi:hypothetical protein